MLLRRGHLGQCRSAHAQQAALIVTSLILQLWSVTAVTDFGVPANLTIRDSTPYAVCLTWSLTAGGGGGGRKGEGQAAGPVQLQLIYRPVNASYRVVADLHGHRRSATLDNLRPETQYRLVMTSSVNGSLVGTSPVIFFHTPPTLPLGFVPSSYSDREEMLSAEEIGIIIIVLGVWMMAIVLFFNRWGKIRMLEPYEYNFKYHHPIPEVANHRPSCPLADGAPLLQTSFDRHCSLDRRLAPYGRRCSSLSAYLSTEPRMIRNNSDPAPPHPPGQPRPGGYRSSMQELRRETAHYGPDLAPAVGRPARTAQDSPVAVAVVQGVAETSGVSRVSPAPPQAGVGRGSPTVARRETGREVGLTRGRSVVAEEGRLAGEVGGRRAEPSRALERPRELLLNLERDGHPAETGTAPGKTSEPDRRQKLTKPFRLICRETETEPARDSEV